MRALCLLAIAALAATAPAAEDLRWSPSAGLAGPHREPAVAVAEDAGFAIAWSGADALGRSRILLSRDASEPAEIDATSAGENREPSLAYAPGAGAPAVAWVNRTREAQAILFIDAKGSEPVVVSATDTALIESPLVGFLDEDSPAIAWTETDATTSSVWFAWRFNGEWSTRRLTPEGSGYDVQPQFLKLPAPRLCWYSLAGAEATLRCADVALWGVGRAEDIRLGEVAVNRLPILADQASAEHPLAAWIEAMPQGDELVIAGTGRLKVRSAAAPDRARQFDPSLLDGGGYACLEELPDGTRRLRAALPDSGPFTVPTAGSARQARADFRGGLFVAAWVNDPSEGGDGAVEALVRRSAPTSIAEAREGQR
jgi:hypothetical protein